MNDATPRAESMPTNVSVLDATVVREHLAFVRRIAQRFARRLPSHIRLEDLIGAGVVGLLEALQRYDSSRATDFQTYAEFRIKGAMLDELRRRDLMARDARMEAKHIEQAIQALTQNLAREPEEDEIARELDLSVDQLRNKLGKLTPVKVMSFHDITPMETPTSSQSPLEHTERRELLSLLEQSLNKLGKRHQQVLHLYYYEELTLKEIGEVLAVSESRVCQIVSEATLRLRAMMSVDVSQRVNGKLPKNKEQGHV